MYHKSGKLCLYEPSTVSDSLFVFYNAFFGVLLAQNHKKKRRINFVFDPCVVRPPKWPISAPYPAKHGRSGNTRNPENWRKLAKTRKNEKTRPLISDFSAELTYVRPISQLVSMWPPPSQRQNVQNRQKLSVNERKWVEKCHGVGYSENVFGGDNQVFLSLSLFFITFVCVLSSNEANCCRMVVNTGVLKRLNALISQHYGTGEIEEQNYNTWTVNDTARTPLGHALKSWNGPIRIHAAGYC